MRALLSVTAVGLIAACSGPQAPAAAYQEIAASEAVLVLKSSDSPYSVIYHPAVDLAKR